MVNGHHAPEAVDVADRWSCAPPRRIAPAQKNSVILPNGVHGDVHAAPDHADLVDEHTSEYDVGKLADR